MEDQQDRISALEATVAALVARTEAQDREIARLRSAASPVARAPEAPRRSADAAGSDGDLVDRRTALRRAGIAAAAVAGGAAVLGEAGPAAAASGDPLVVGATVVQDMAAPTALSYDPQVVEGGALFNVFDVRAASIGSISGQPAMVAGRAESADPPFTGVFGSSQSVQGPGVFAEGAGYGLIAVGARAPVLLGANSDPTASGEFHEAGELLVDDGGTWWVCVAPGTPGTWRRLGSPTSVGALTLWDSPRRAYDSRPGNDPLGVAKGLLAPGTNRTIDLKVNAGVPAGATAALCNVTVTDTAPSGWLKVFKAGGTIPSGTNLNWFQAGSVVANATTVALSGEKCTLRTGSGSANVVVDVIGYYR